MLDFPTRFEENRTGLRFLQHYAPHNVYHSGVDYNFGYGNQDKGQLVITPTIGVVEYVSPRGTNGGLGNYIVIYHPNFGVWTRFLHLDSICVSIGQVLQRGQAIGTLGDSGTTSAHLHAECLNAKGLQFIKDYWRPYGRYPSGLSKQAVASMFIDFHRWVIENNHPLFGQQKVEQIAKAIKRAKGMRKIRLQRVLDRILMRLGF